jgi:NAD(P)-dependent dehydrogenase (short-subunit alcohol dehydrogenase family)
LINNAGVAIGGGFLHTSLEDWNWIVSINVMGVVHGCHFFVPAMVARSRRPRRQHRLRRGLPRQRRAGRVQHDQFAVVGLSEALQDELAPHRISVTTICPGLINTPITRNARMRGPDASPESRQRLIEIYARRNYTPEQVAAAILIAVQRDRVLAPVAIEAWVMYYLKRLSPALVRFISRIVQTRARAGLRQ